MKIMGSCSDFNLVAQTYNKKTRSLYSRYLGFCFGIVDNSQAQCCQSSVLHSSIFKYENVCAEI